MNYFEQVQLIPPTKDSFGETTFLKTQKRELLSAFLRILNSISSTPLMEGVEFIGTKNFSEIITV